MKKHLFKLSAFILSLCTAICSIPLTLAAAGDSLESEEVDPLPAEDESSADENVPFIIGEDDELRAESVKHFRLSDGSYLMVDYGTPVHYESDGDWLDIDNTLVSRDGRYENAQGESKVSFSADEYSDELYTLESGGHRLTLGAASHDALPAARPSEPAVELPTAVTSEAVDTVSDGEASEAAKVDVVSDAAADTVASDGVASRDAADDSVSDAANLPTGEAVDENAAVGGMESAAEPSAVSDSSDDSETPAVPDSYDGDSVTAEPAQRSTKREIVLGGFDSERSADSDEAQTAEYSAALSEARSTALTVSEYIDENPYATEEELSEVREEQNGKNMRQRAEIIGSVRNQDKIGYRGVFDGAALEYTLGGGMVKEDIIIAERADSYVYSFELDTALTLERDGDGLVLRDGEQTVFVLPAPYMTDAAGSRSDAVSYSFERREGGYTLTVTADGRWIDSDERVFPVTVDPTVSTSPSYTAGNITTEYICDNNVTNKHTNENKWMMGRSPSSGNYYSFFKFNNLPYVPYNGRVVAAYLLISAMSSSKLSVSDFNIIVKRALPDWRTQITSNVANTNPVLDYYSFDHSDVDDGSGKYISMDLSGDLNNLKSDGTGYIFYSLNTDGSNMTDSAYYNVAFRGASAQNSYNPVLVLQYRDLMGIENYRTARTTSANVAGDAYINDYSGNLVLQRPLVSEAGVTISYVYNSRYGDMAFTSSSPVYHTVDYSNMLSAVGWRLSVQQSVVTKNLTLAGVNMEYLIYTDGDGTEHWFVPIGENRWRDEDGLNLVATREGSRVTIIDLDGNKKIFIHGYLWSLEDINENKVFLLYDTKDFSTTAEPKSSSAGGKNCLSRILYRSASCATIVVADFEYTKSYLSAIIDRNGDKTTMTLTDTDNMLKYIISPDEENGSLYEYRDFPYRMIYAYDTYTRFGLEFSYDMLSNASGSKDVVTGFATFERDYWNGVHNEIHYLSKVDIDYSSRETVYTNKGHNFEDSSDDIITAVSFDTMGRTVSTRTTTADGLLLSAAGAGYSVNDGTSPNNNKIIREGYTGAVRQNLLYNGGFEKSAYWTAIGASEYSSIEAYTGAQSMKISTTSTSQKSAAYNLVLLNEGTYTLTARVKVTSAVASDSKVGARIYAEDTSGTMLGESISVNKITSETIDNGWLLLHCTFDVLGLIGVRAGLSFSGTIGTAYFDNVTLQKGDNVGAYNLLDNGDFSNGIMSWTKSGTVASEITVKSVSDSVSGASNNVLYIPAAPHKDAGAYQVVNMNIPATETLMLSAFAKASSAPLDDEDDAIFEIGAILTYGDGTTDTFKQSYNSRLFDTWQFIALPIVPRRPKNTIKTARVYVRYAYNVNAAYFDSFTFTLDGAQCYSYDENGNVVTVNRTNTDEISNLYDGADLISNSGGANGMFEYEYDGKHNITKVKNAGLEMTLDYDINGNAKSTQLQSGSQYMSTSATSVDGGTKVKTVTNSDGVTVENVYYVNTDLLKSVSVPFSDTAVTSDTEATTVYTYDDNDRMDTVTQDGLLIDYAYYCGNIKRINRKPVGDTGSGQSYYFSYNRYGQRLNVKINLETIITYAYDDTTHNMISATYGNGKKETFEYDALDRLRQKKNVDLGQTVRYTYDNLGNIVEENSYKSPQSQSVHYEYDRLGRVTRTYNTQNGYIVEQSEKTYDSKGRDDSYTYIGKDYSYGIGCEYDENGRCVKATQLYNGENEIVAVLAYGSFGRLRFRIYAGDYSGRVSYTYAPYADDENRITSHMTSMRYTFGGKQTYADYSYDNIGNIKTESYKYDGSIYSNVSYTYDSANRLQTEEYGADNVGVSPYKVTYTYDAYGNIKAALRESGALVTSQTYSYSNSARNDLLTMYNGRTITYDAIGNPLTYFNGTEYTFNWKGAKQLNDVTIGEQKINYEYNHRGLRTKKGVVGK